MTMSPTHDRADDEHLGGRASRAQAERVEVVLDPGAHVPERPRIAGGAKRRDVGFGEALIARLQLVRKRDVANRRPSRAPR